MLTIYFSGTGNTKHLADLFSQKMNAKCISIEADTDFSTEIKEHDTLAFCYPIYNSRVPRIMREFVHKHMAGLVGKKIIILVTQQAFSGDGARVFTDLFEEGAIEVIYAEHFNMQQNMGNIPVFWTLFKPTEKTRQKYIKKTEAKLNTVCENIKSSIVKKRGFSKISEILGYIQGKPWQKNTKDITPVKLEKKLMNGLQIHKECTACGICTKICPMKNLVNHDGKIQHLNNCTICYRCVNRCPQKAVTVYIHIKPKWQYAMGDLQEK
ncbi:MAG: EFR1 family ferrodoxin [Defluviitaleaceae bacterium]|nr:EFR1 family ferrodoxin [Defluviitaleaceae bacterium]MCL2264037.1 EFR1 family ferrodoxin [Defluviitaleaceae bacterium]